MADALLEGDITAEQAARLLDAVDAATPEAPAAVKGTAPRWLKIQVQEKGRERPNVNITVPFALIKMGLKLAPLGLRFAPEDAQAKISASGVDLNALDVDAIAMACCELGEYPLVDVDDEGEHVKIWVE